MSAIITLVFLGLSFLILQSVLHFSKRATLSRSPEKDMESTPPLAKSEKNSKTFPALEILKQEFEYARITASEALHDRHTMVNYYLLIVSIFASGAIYVFGTDTQLPPLMGTALLWLLCGIGWLYFLMIIRLRQAWHESIQAMNQIKLFYVHNNIEFEAQELYNAFQWHSGSLPAVDKAWTLFFFSAMLIGLINSAAYAMGGLLLSQGRADSLIVLLLMLLFGLLYFLLHARFYFAFLAVRK